MIAIFLKMRLTMATLEVALTMTLRQMAETHFSLKFWVSHKTQTVQIMQFQVVRSSGAEMRMLRGALTRLRVAIARAKPQPAKRAFPQSEPS